MDKSTNNTDVLVNGTTAEEPSVTMVEVLEYEKELEDEYAAVLGASDEKCCTYAQGPVKRQALYSCLTCTPEAAKNLEAAAGVCLACSYRCHENHELVELYTKRDFRCDCPTARFAKNCCVLNAGLEKPQPRNENNKYNQNFQGKYCNCHRPYPDPDRTAEEVMIQCIVCEDWYHLQHLDVPDTHASLMEACSEMICGNCMNQHTFLKDYTGLALKSVEQTDELPTNIPVVAEDEPAAENNANPKNETKDAANESNVAPPSPKRLKLDEDGSSASCSRPTAAEGYEKGATFWTAEWRAALCRCATCMDMYKSQQMEYLLDAEDSATSYEERGLRRAATESSTYEQGIQALSSMDRVQQIDAITEYNNMKDKLKVFLNTFAVANKVVTADDINNFFEKMRREKHSMVGQPHFCR